MDASMDSVEPIGDPAVTIGRDDTYLGIYPPDIAEKGYVRLPVVVQSPTVRARSVLDLCGGWGGWIPGFTGYFDELAARWQAWDGAREWEDDEHGVTLKASHPPTGSIELAVGLNPTFGAMVAGGWVLEIVVPIEPGQLGSIARSIHELLDRHL